VASGRAERRFVTMEVMTEHSARKIFLIRHAEKPTGTGIGVLESGEQDDKSLSVRGWQRAGALAVYFGDAKRDGVIEAPRFLFASHSSSARPEKTLVPLAEKLGVNINLTFGKGDEDQLVKAAIECEGPVLICWQHDYMVAVADRILGDNQTAPREWPTNRFDMTWVFDWDAAALRYGFTQAPQRLLGGDSEAFI
jgi:hypothetical protein